MTDCTRLRVKSTSCVRMHRLSAGTDELNATAKQLADMEHAKEKLKKNGSARAIGV